MAELRRVAVERGEGVTVLVSGEAGVGKTRFAAQIADNADAEGWSVFRGSCDEFGAEARPFAALHEMAPAIRRFLADLAPSELERPAWKAIQRITAPTIADGRDGGSVVHLARDLFQRMAVIRPILVIYDDLHWADESSRTLFATLAQGFQSVPAIVLGCYRADEVNRGHPLLPVLAAVHRQVSPEQFRLCTFDRDEARCVATAIVGELHVSHFEDVFGRSGGNAFLLEELLASPSGVLPQGVQDVVLARLDALSAAAVLVAEAASLETTVARDTLAGITRQSPLKLAAALDELCERGFLEAQGMTYTFRHPLIREAVERRIQPGRLAVLHGRMAEELERHESSRLGEIARHWFEAGDKPRALAASIAAAHRARRGGAWPEAADQFERALGLWDRLPQSDRPDVTKLALTEWHGRLALVSYAEEAMQHARRFVAASQLIEATLAGDEHLTSSQRAILLFRLSWAYFYATDSATFSNVLRTLRECVGALDDSVDVNAQIRLLSAFACTVMSNFGCEGEAQAALERASSLAETTATVEPPILRSGWAWLRATSGEIPDVEEFVAGAPADGPRIRQLVGLHEENATEGVLHCDRMFERGLGPVEGINGESFVGRSFVRLSRWVEALDRFRIVRERLGDDAFERWPDLTVDAWGPALVRTGDLDTARHWLARAAPMFVPGGVIDTIGGFTLTRVELARANGDPPATRAAVSAALSIASGHIIAFCSEATAFAVALEADCALDGLAVAPGTVDIVDGWIATLQSCLDEAPGRWRIEDLGMFIEQAHAERQRLLGDDAPAVWESLAARWEALPRPYHAAYARYRAAHAVLTARSASRKEGRDCATRHLHAALVICREIGAVLLQNDIIGLMRTAGIRELGNANHKLPGPPHPDVPVLTIRELDVLRLVVRGSSNGQIAIQLGISPKTASVHVSNILRKLDATNRVQAAVRAARLGLVPSVERA